MAAESLSLIANQAAGVVVPFLFKLVGAVALWIVGGWLIQFSLRLIRRLLNRGSLDVTVISYLINILGALLRVVLVVAILGFFGIETASFAALLAGAGVEGTVEEVGMFVTSITAPDNVRHYVGNAKLFGDNIINYSARPYRRVELVAQLDHSADVARAIALLREGIQRVPNQVEDKPADVEVLEFSERGPRLAVRPYTHTSNYWQVYFDTNRMIVDVLGGAGFPVPRIPVGLQNSSLG